jgi:competence protein ComEA
LIAVAKNTQSAQKVKVTGKINLNKASAAELSSIKGIGSKKAQAIVDYRKKKGDFTDIKQLIKVRGIGHSMLAKITPHLTI